MSGLADRRPVLQARGRIAAALRAFFANRDFIEVETPILQVSPGNETHLHAFQSELVGTDGVPHPRYLRTSPEFACKKLLSAGEQRIFEFARVFRNREAGPLHHPEFTMLEWYRAREPYKTLMADCTTLLGIAAATARSPRWSYRGRTMDPFSEPQRVSVAEAFDRHARIDLFPLLADFPDPAAFAEAASQAEVQTAPDDSWGDIFSRVLVEKIEPRLGEGRATLLYEYPAIQSALARPVAHDPRIAERFELYACGVELANAFGEQTNPIEQRRRLVQEMNEKERLYGERYPLDEEFLAALRTMPPASGCALGFDRLVMLATGATRIDQVLWLPVAGA